ncbi:MAG TPA: hypothetical protein VN608_10905, partial [Clostridia bacterium]|nr:hypothetical protein [Clostridia bacterium]
ASGQRRNGRLTCSICLLALLLLLSSCGKYAEVNTVNAYTPEQIGDMLIAFCTTDKDERYSKLLEGVDELMKNITAAPANAPPGIVMVPELDALIIDYHAEVAAYMTDKLKEKIIANRELSRLDEIAAEWKVSIKAERVEIVEVSGEDGRYEFTIYAELTDADGAVTDTEQHGSFVMSDGLVDSLSFDGGMKDLFGMTQDDWMKGLLGIIQ